MPHWIFIAIIWIGAFAHPVYGEVWPKTDKPLTVVVSVQPIALILHEIAPNLQVKVLVSANKSAHHYSLSPSDVIALKSADAVFWFGVETEPYLAKVIDSLPGGHAVRLLDGRTTAHAWWNPSAGGEMARQIKEALVAIQPENQSIYDQAYGQFVDQLNELATEIRNARYPKTVAVSHDAYAPLLEFLHIRQLGALADSADHRHGARTVDKIRHAALSGTLNCLVEEPQSSPAIAERLVAGTTVKRVTIDPLGYEANSYRQFLRDAASILQSCVKKIP